MLQLVIDHIRGLKFPLGVLLAPLFITVPSLASAQETVEIKYDDYGVPHIFGTSDEAAYYGAGYAAARDRLFQMHFVRLTMRGELSRWFGQGSTPMNAFGNTFSGGNTQFLASDRKAKKLGYRRYGEYVAAQMLAAPVGSEEKRAHELLSAYTDGVNAYISQSYTPDDSFPDQLSEADGSDRSPMFAENNITVETDPWTVEDCVLAWLDIAVKFESRLDSEHLAQNKVDALGNPTNAEIQEELFGFKLFVDHAATIQVGDMDFGPAQTYATDNGLVQFPRAIESYMPTFSEGTAIRGDALLVEPSVALPSSVLWGGPRITMGLPNILHEFYFSGPSFAARGAGVPGSPNLLVGFNAKPESQKGSFDSVAWSVASQRNDVVDLFELTVPTGGTTYLLDGVPTAFSPYQVETIEVLQSNGSLSTETVIYAETVWGPMVTDLAPGDHDLIGQGNDKHYAAAISTIWKANPLPISLDTSLACIAMTRADGIDEFMKAVTTQFRAPCTSMVIADSAGNVGYTATGEVPVRANGDPWAGILPGDGNDPLSAWQTFVPYNLRPQTINPARGYVHTANQIPVHSDYALLRYYAGSGDNVRSYRLRRFLESSAMVGGPSLGSIEDLSKDVTRHDALDITELAEFCRWTGWATYPMEVQNLLSELVAWHPEIGAPGSGELDGNTIGSVLAAFMKPIVLSEDSGVDCLTLDIGRHSIACFPSTMSAANISVLNEYGSGDAGGLNMLIELRRAINLVLVNDMTLATFIADFTAEMDLLGEWILYAECATQVELAIGITPEFCLPANGCPLPCDPMNWTPLSTLFTEYQTYRLTSGSTAPLGPSRAPGFRAVGFLSAWFRHDLPAPLEPAGTNPQHIPFGVNPISAHLDVLADIHNVTYNQYCPMGPKLDECRTILGGGQSEKPNSAHFSDQMDEQALGETKPAPVTEAKINTITAGNLSFMLTYP